MDAKDSSSTILGRRQVDWDKLKGKLLSEETRGEFNVEVRETEETGLAEDKLKQLSESSFSALRLAHQVSQACDKDIVIYCDDKSQGYLDVGMNASRQMVGDEPQSQTAAILHELLHGLQEDEIGSGGNTEILPNIAEFLFTGESRIPYFRHLHNNPKAESLYRNAWKTVTKILLPETTNGNPNETFEMLLEKRKLPEAEKINLVKKSIELLSR